MSNHLATGSLFSGVGGLEKGLEASGLGNVVWQSEIDPAASSVLAKHWGCPNLGDVTQVDWSKVEPVDVLCGGFPCQPASQAGARHGRSDDRWLWPEFARAIASLRPRLVIAENVPGLLGVDGGAAFGEVLGDLARLGYTATWGLLSAFDLGACHRRDRLFIAAFADESDLPVLPPGPLLAWRDGTAWRHVQSSLLGGLAPVWPRSGLLSPSGAHVLRTSPWSTGTDVEETLLLPTPTASNPNDGEDLGNWLARRQRQVLRGLNGNGMGTPLAVAVRLLPTPQSRDGSHGGGQAKRLSDPRRSNDLDDAVLTLFPTPRATRGGSATETVQALCPTPTCADARNGRSATANRQAGSTPRTGMTLSDVAWSGDWGRYEAAVRRHEVVLGECAPSPTETGPKGSQRLSPAFVRWMMMFSPRWCGDLSRSAQLRCYGNAVVPAVSEAVARVVITRSLETRTAPSCSPRERYAV
ncbi:MAG: DNA cytosine methyltransferase [Acidimicrobiales bacterium]